LICCCFLIATSHTASLDENGRLWTWGKRAANRLGHSTDTGIHTYVFPNAILLFSNVFVDNSDSN
jgi:alpha-tubulin suppressor-like RCC1 family protein